MNHTCPAEAMTAVDRAWLEMGDAHNPMIVSAILTLSGAEDLPRLVTVILERLLRFPRFCQWPDRERHPPAWTHQEELLLGYHVRVHPLPRAQPDAHLRAAIASELESALDPCRPLWRLTLFPGRGGRVAILFRAHHAMADGIALMHVLQSLTDQVAGARHATTHSRRHRRHGGPLGGLIDRLESANTALQQIAAFVADDLRHPAHLAAQLREGRDLAAAIGGVLALPDDNPAAFAAPLSGRRQVAWTQGIELAPVRRLARALDAKVNDVFLCALAGAFGRYLARHGGVDREQNLRVSIPVNLRPPTDGTLGNCFGLVLVDLPAGVADWRERLATVGARMRMLKGSAQARATLVGLAAAGSLPVVLEKRLVRLVAGKAVAVVSNLRGPEQPMHIGGVRLDSIVFWPPQAGGNGIGVSLFSYAGSVTLGVSADTGVLAAPAELVAALEVELADMLAAGPGRGQGSRRDRTRLSAGPGRTARRT